MAILCYSFTLFEQLPALKWTGKWEESFKQVIEIMCKSGRHYEVFTSSRNIGGNQRFKQTRPIYTAKRTQI